MVKANPVFALFGVFLAGLSAAPAGAAPRRSRLGADPVGTSKIIKETTLPTGTSEKVEVHGFLDSHEALPFVR